MQVLCTKRAPNCGACPLRPGCEYARGTASRRQSSARQASAAQPPQHPPPVLPGRAQAACGRPSGRRHRRSRAVRGSRGARRGDRRCCRRAQLCRDGRCRASSGCGCPAGQACGASDRAGPGAHHSSWAEAAAVSTWLPGTCARRRAGCWHQVGLLAACLQPRALHVGSCMAACLNLTRTYSQHVTGRCSQAGRG